MRLFILAVAIFISFAGCTKKNNHESQTKTTFPVVPPGASHSDPNLEAVAESMRRYCQSCHGLGDIRFISSDDNTVFIDSLFTERSPLSNQPWAVAIGSVLTWPGTSAPEMDATLNGSVRYMPLGMVREEFSTATLAGNPLREFIISVLNAELIRRESTVSPEPISPEIQ